MKQFFTTAEIASASGITTRAVIKRAQREGWLLGPDDFWPDLGREGAPEPRRLIERYAQAAAGGR